MLARTTESSPFAHEVLVHRAHAGRYRHPQLLGETRIFDREGRFDAGRFDSALAATGNPNPEPVACTLSAVVVSAVRAAQYRGRSMHTHL